MNPNPTDFVNFHVNASRLLIITWIGSVPSDIFRQAIDQVAEMAAQDVFDKMLIDSRRQNLMSKEDNDYISASLPNLFNQGVRKIALLLPNLVLTKISIRQFERGNKSQISINHFESKEEALAWLREI